MCWLFVPGIWCGGTDWNCDRLSDIEINYFDMATILRRNTDRRVQRMVSKPKPERGISD